MSDAFDVFRDERLEVRFATLGTRSPCCSVAGCRETNPFALSGTHPNLVCAEHRASNLGHVPIDGHHSKGRANDADDVIPALANDHAVLSELQRFWPQRTLRNPDGSPLLRAAAALRGWLDVLRLMLERTVGWIPDFLESLDAWLSQRLGTRWWNEFDT
jgi:hypothetical protein